MPPLFKLIQEESQTEWQEMYQVFNMGCRLEIYCDEKIAENLVNTAKLFNIDAQIIGRVHNSKFKGEKLTIKSEKGDFSYT